MKSNVGLSSCSFFFFFFEFVGVRNCLMFSFCSFTTVLANLTFCFKISCGDLDLLMFSIFSFNAIRSSNASLRALVSSCNRFASSCCLHSSLLLEVVVGFGFVAVTEDDELDDDDDDDDGDGLPPTPCIFFTNAIRSSNARFLASANNFNFSDSSTRRFCSVFCRLVSCDCFETGFGIAGGAAADVLTGLPPIPSNFFFNAKRSSNARFLASASSAR